MIWLPYTEMPAPKHFEVVAGRGEGSAVYGDLKTLVMNDWHTKPSLSAHIKMPTGSGSAFFDEHCIHAMREAFVCKAESDL
ncbi:MAG: hypothetical protein ACRCS5_12780 [Sphingomonas sp.]|uniref:hypothetical protein n=1 Tax=Sphingomonas sp. TaxID=28214 RepID=UPI0030FB467D